MVDIKTGIGFIYGCHNGKNNRGSTSETCKGDKYLLVQAAFKGCQNGRNSQRSCGQCQKQGDGQGGQEDAGSCDGVARRPRRKKISICISPVIPSKKVYQ